MRSPDSNKRRIRLFLTASFITNIGGWMQSGAIPYLVYRDTHNAGWVGTATFFAFVPSMLATIPGGHLADRRNRSVLLGQNQLILGVLTSILCLAALENLANLQVLLEEAA